MRRSPYMSLAEEQIKLVENCSDELYSFAYHACLDKELAEEITSETFNHCSLTFTNKKSALIELFKISHQLLSNDIRRKNTIVLHTGLREKTKDYALSLGEQKKLFLSQIAWADRCAIILRDTFLLTFEEIAYVLKINDPLAIKNMVFETKKRWKEQTKQVLAL